MILYCSILLCSVFLLDSFSDLPSFFLHLLSPGLESFVLRCPREVAPFLGDVLKVSVGFMRYDPNYSYDEDEEEQGSGDEDQMSVDGDDEEGGSDEDYGEDEEGGGSDDDDTSWKVIARDVYLMNAIFIRMAL